MYYNIHFTQLLPLKNYFLNILNTTVIAKSWNCRTKFKIQNNAFVEITLYFPYVAEEVLFLHQIFEIDFFFI